MDTIRTERLAIRNFQADDWQALQRMVVKYAASEYGAYDHRWPEGDEAIIGVAEWFASGDNFLAVCLADTGTFIGFVVLNPEDEAGKALNLGYIFDSDFHGHGYVTEACQAALERAFVALGAERMVTGTAAANQPSCRLIARLGFQITGEGVGSFQNAPDGTPIKFAGYSFALSRDEWSARRQG